jgi:hypothetical protein
VLSRLQGISFIIQSDKYSAAHLALQVELFVRDTLQRIASLPEVRDADRSSSCSSVLLASALCARLP